MPDFWVLNNGLRIVGERNPKLHSVTAAMTLRVGSALESPAENGWSHVMEHMAFKGTADKTALALSEESDLLGGRIDAYTAKDCTCYHGQVITEDLPRLLTLIHDLVCLPAIREEDLEREKCVILEELAMDEDNPGTLAADLVNKLRFGEGSLGMPVGGTPELVNAATPDALRAFRRKHYTPEQAVLGIAGSYDPDTVLPLCESIFGAWEQGSGCLAIPVQQHLTGIRGAMDRDFEQMQIMLAYEGQAYGSGNAAVESALCNILGVSASSRLYQRIREELGLAYDVYAGRYAFPGVGTIDLGATVSPANTLRVAEEMGLVLKNLLRDGITEKEFAYAKRTLRINLLMSADSTSGRIGSLSMNLLNLNRMCTVESLLQNVERVTPEAIMDLAHQVLERKPCLALVGRDAETLLQEVCL